MVSRYIVNTNLGTHILTLSIYVLKLSWVPTLGTQVFALCCVYINMDIIAIKITTTNKQSLWSSGNIPRE